MNGAVVCPYCRMPFDDGSSPAKIYCTACGVPHHEDCYQENGGCTVFGCARAPADDPKLHVSYSDLNAAAAAQSAAAIQQGVAPLSQSPYVGQQGFSRSASVAGFPFPATTSLYARQAYAFRHAPKSRTTYIVLGVFLGAFGAHNFYAGYTGRAVGQLCLTVLTLFYLSIASWIWAIVEICVVEKDSTGIQFS